MSVDLNKLVGWYDRHVGELTYSMLGSRNGTDGTADCSGSVVQAIRDAGGTPYSWLYNTESLGDYLAANGFKLIARNQDWVGNSGDVILMNWADKANSMKGSGGAGGHVGVLKDANTFISTDYWTGGQDNTAVSEHNWNDYYNTEVANGLQYVEAWRLTDSTPANDKPVNPANNVTPDTPAIKRFKQFKNEFTAYSQIRVDEIKFVNDIWQFVNYDLAGGKDFYWTDNGISLARVDNNTRSNEDDTQVGDMVAFNSENNEGTIDEYDAPSNAVGIKFGDDGIVWFDADKALAL